PEFRPDRGPAARFLLLNHADLPVLRPPLLRFPIHAGAVKFDLIPEGVARWGGQLIVALFGDEIPMVAPRGPRAGRSVARIDPSDWSLHPFVKGSLHRPIDVKFNVHDGSLYVLDFGRFEMTGQKCVRAKARSGALWKMALA
ncbi:MAG TPA: sugar dehydrogenase, partial [Verrucomicrobiae bacterium]|nr:sugar dehydrogenase [Verrucomicrobiae bacterium]